MTESVVLPPTIAFGLIEANTDITACLSIMAPTFVCFYPFEIRAIHTTTGPLVVILQGLIVDSGVFSASSPIHSSETRHAMLHYMGSAGGLDSSGRLLANAYTLG